MANWKYKVKAGDTLWALAERYYGDGRKYPKLARLNKIKNPDHIEIGQTLTMPMMVLDPIEVKAGPDEDVLTLKAIKAAHNLLLVVLPASTSPFSDHLLDKNAKVEIHYQFLADATVLDSGKFPFKPADKETRSSMPVKDADWGKITKLQIWVEPYAYASVMSPGDDLARGMKELAVPSPTTDGQEFKIEVLMSPVQFIVDEMNTNKTDPMIAEVLKHNNDAAAQAAAGKKDEAELSKNKALIRFARRVRTNEGFNSVVATFGIWWKQKGWTIESGATDGQWDHKPRLRPVWGTDNRLGFDPDKVYYYDVYSNIHYAYVGNACGFTLQELLDGANTQQESDQGTGDEQTDKDSITEGFNLFVSGKDVTVEEVVTILQKHDNWQKSERKRAWDAAKQKAKDKAEEERKERQPGMKPGWR